MAMAQALPEVYELARTLELPPGPDADDGAEHVRAALAGFHCRLEALRHSLNRLPRAAFESMLVNSRETPTHFKWALYRGPRSGLTLWLHEYKPPDLVDAAYVEAPHNHRYGFTSLILTGGYLHTRFLVEPAGQDRARVTDVRPQVLAPGDTYTLTPDDWHNVTRAREGTVTLIAQNRPTRAYSTSLDTAPDAPLGARTGTLRCHYPVEARWRTLRSVLGRPHERKSQ
ncbi:hypothetical protein [Streptomyces sp. NPDC087300]|uniref:hypothetical protein n=1 Tax=Streptomyces sp. NPDC087300 TaxID=3365780 RepID=UPI003823AB35